MIPRQPCYKVRLARFIYDSVRTAHQAEASEISIAALGYAQKVLSDLIMKEIEATTKEHVDEGYTCLDNCIKKLKAVLP